MRVEVKIKYGDIINYSYVELDKLLEYCKFRLSDFLLSEREETHIELRLKKRDLLISFYRNKYSSRVYSFIYNGYIYSYQKRIKGLTEWCSKFVDLVKNDLKEKEVKNYF